MDNNELKHWGVRGMKWGVRRYQNKDGSLTPAGKKRYDKEMEKLKAEEKVLRTKARTQAKLGKLDSKRQEIEELKRKLRGDDPDNTKSSPKEESVKPVKTNTKVNLKKISDSDLQAVVNRLRNEESYEKMTAPKHRTIGRAFIDDIFKPSVTDASKNILTDVLKKKGKSWVDGLLDSSK